MSEVEKLFEPTALLSDMDDARRTVYSVQGILHLVLQDVSANPNRPQGKTDIVNAIRAASTLMEQALDGIENVYFGLEQMA